MSMQLLLEIAGVEAWHGSAVAAPAHEPGKVPPPRQAVRAPVVVASLVGPAGPRKHEDLRGTEVPVGRSQADLLPPQSPGGLVRDVLAGERQPLRLPLVDLRDQLVHLDPPWVPVADQVGEPEAQLDHPLVLLGSQPPRGQPAEVQALPEIVARGGVVVVTCLRALGACETTEDDARFGTHDVRQHLHGKSLPTRGEGEPRGVGRAPERGTTALTAWTEPCLAWRGMVPNVRGPGPGPRLA